MYCNKCGAQIPDDSAFCPKCGAKISANTDTELKPEPKAEAAAPKSPSNDKKKLLYTAKRSVWAYSNKILAGVALIIVGIVFGIAMFVAKVPIGGIGGIAIAIVGGVVIALSFWAASRYEILFYDGKIVVKSGILSTREDQSIMTPIIGVSVKQNFWGKIFNYGSVVIDKTGKGWDITTSYIKNPQDLKVFLEKLIEETDVSKLNMYISN